MVALWVALQSPAPSLFEAFSDFASGAPQPGLAPLRVSGVAHGGGHRAGGLPQTRLATPCVDRTLCRLTWIPFPPGLFPLWHSGLAFSWCLYHVLATGVSIHTLLLHLYSQDPAPLMSSLLAFFHG